MIRIFAFAVLTVLSLSACSTATKEKLGLNKKAPNEFMVTPRAPLSLPPEYDLRPVVEPQTSDGEADEGFSDSEQGLLERMNG